MIETLKVQNYKSLKNIDIPLKPLTVLVGPNAAGKSNILDCLAFLTDISDPKPPDINQPFSRRGGYGDMVWGGERLANISISCRWQPPTNVKVSFDYAIEIKYAPHGPQLNVVSEHLVARDRGLGEVVFNRKDTTIHYDSNEKVIPLSLSILREPPEPLVQTVQDTIRRWTFYEFVMSNMRQRQPVTKQTHLNPDGSNVASLLHSIFSEGRKSFSQVEEHLKAAIPEIDELISPITEDGKTYVAWREKDIPGRIPAWNMSEGSVRLVAILLGLLAPQPLDLVTFESPDLHLHAHLMQYLAEILKAGSRHSQIIITTHSPYLLDHIPPENMLIVWKEAGETKVRPVTDTTELREALKTLGLGELYYAGQFGGVP